MYDRVGICGQFMMNARFDSAKLLIRGGNTDWRLGDHL